MAPRKKERPVGSKSKEAGKAMISPEQSTDEDRLSMFKQRNRVAASKSREKKKQYVLDLEDTRIELETNNIRLHLEHMVLVNEVGLLKHHLMAHGHCNDRNINKWLTNEARRFVDTSSSIQSSSSHSSPLSLGSGEYGGYGVPGWSEQDLSTEAKQADIMPSGLDGGTSQNNMEFP